MRQHKRTAQFKVANVDRSITAASQASKIVLIVLAIPIKIDSQSVREQSRAKATVQSVLTSPIPEIRRQFKR